MSGADNQQERLALLGYLAGIIDGEGWIGLTKIPKKDNVCGYSIFPSLAVHMVGKDAVEHVHNICETLGFASYLIHLESSSRWQLKGFKRIVPVLEALLPYLYIKQAQARLVIECANERKLRHHHSNPSLREEALMVEIKSLNMKGKNPQRLYA